MALTGMAELVMTIMLLSIPMLGHTIKHITDVPLYSYGLYGYGLDSYGLYRYGLYSYGRSSDGLDQVFLSPGDELRFASCAKKMAALWAVEPTRMRYVIV